MEKRGSENRLGRIKIAVAAATLSAAFIAGCNPSAEATQKPIITPDITPTPSLVMPSPEVSPSPTTVVIPSKSPDTSPSPSPVEVSPSPAEPMSAKDFYEAAKKSPLKNLNSLNTELNKAIQLDPNVTSDLTVKRLHDILSNCFNNKNDGEIECTAMVQAFFRDFYPSAATPEAKATDLQFGIDVAHLGLAKYPSFDAQLKRTLGLTPQ